MDNMLIGALGVSLLFVIMKVKTDAGVLVP